MANDDRRLIPVDPGRLRPEGMRRAAHLPPGLGPARLDVPWDAYSTGRLVDEAIEAGDFDRARGLAEVELAQIRDAEQARGTPLHKGHPLYSIGVVEFGREPLSGRRYIMAAHAEDARTWPWKRPIVVVAGRVLTELFKFPKKLLSALGRRARIDGFEDPVAVADDFAATHLLPPLSFSVVTEHSRADAELNGVAREVLVFVGGNYSRCIDRIYNARQVVEEAGFVPVLVREFRDRTGEAPRKKSFRFLDWCPSALFEASESGGWVPEFERLANNRPRTPTLLVFAADRANKSHPSVMLPDQSDMPGLLVRPYGTTGDMRYEVLRWLQSRPGGPARPTAGPAAAAPSTPLAYPSNSVRLSGPARFPGSATITPSGAPMPSTVLRPPTGMKRPKDR